MAGQTEHIIHFLEPLVQREGYQSLDVWLVSEHGQKIVRVFIDKDSGPITLDDCSVISHAVGDPLDVENIIEGHYNLEISSPGLDRPLRTLDHFLKVLEQTIFVYTKEKIQGRKRYKGQLKAVLQEHKIEDAQGPVLQIFIDNQDFFVPISLIEKAHLVSQF